MPVALRYPLNINSITAYNPAMKYNLVKHPLFPNEKALAVEGTPLSCPFQNFIAMPGQISGTANLVPVACGTWCALFVHENNVIKLNCSPCNTATGTVEPEKPKITL